MEDDGCGYLDKACFCRAVVFSYFASCITMAVLVIIIVDASYLMPLLSVPLLYALHSCELLELISGPFCLVFT